MKRYSKFLALFLALITVSVFSFTAFADTPNYSKTISNVGKKLSAYKFDGTAVYAAMVSGVKINAPALERYSNSAAKSGDFKYIAEAVVNLSAAGKDVGNVCGTDLVKKLDTLSVSALAVSDSAKKSELSPPTLYSLLTQ